MEGAEADELRAAMERRLRSIREYSLPQLRECRGPLSLHAELVGEVRQDLDIVQGQLDELTLLAEDAETSAARQSVLQQAAEVTRELESLRRDIREATLTSKRRIDSTHASSQREELFKSASKLAPTPSSQKGAKAQTDASKDDELMDATANVTDGLRRTRQMMEQELERSSLTTQMLERSSQTLQLTSNQYTSFSDILNASKTLITTLEKADTLDRLLILAALVFFFLVCLLIIKRRIIDRGLRAASVVGKVAGGVGHVGKRGAKAVLGEATQSLTSAASEAISTATAIASAVSVTSASIAAAASSASSSVDSPSSPSSSWHRQSSSVAEVMADRITTSTAVPAEGTTTQAVRTLEAIPEPSALSLAGQEASLDTDPSPPVVKEGVERNDLPIQRQLHADAVAELPDETEEDETDMDVKLLQKAYEGALDMVEALEGPDVAAVVAEEPAPIVHGEL